MQCVLRLVCEGLAGETSVISLDSDKDCRLACEGFSGETTGISLDSGEDWTWTVGVGFPPGESFCSAIGNSNFFNSKQTSLDPQSSLKAIHRNISGTTSASSVYNGFLYFHRDILYQGGISVLTAVHQDTISVTIQV